MIHILIKVITQIGRLLAQKLLHVCSQRAVGHALNSCHIRDDKFSVLCCLALVLRLFIRIFFQGELTKGPKAAGPD